MTVGELKILLEGVDDNTEILIPLNAGDGFDGMFFSPCIEDSGASDVGIDDLDEEDEAEMKLLGIVDTSQPTFLLVPRGFFEEIEDEIDPQMN